MSDKDSDPNLPERLLSYLAKFNYFVDTAFNTDLNKGIVPQDPNALHAGILGDLASQATRIPEDLQLITELIQTGKNHGLTDDKKYLFEHIVQLAASLPSDSSNLKLITNKLIDLLWQNLPHPPISYLGDKWRFRTVDGTNNNRLSPNLGAAGAPYARTVNPKIQLPPTLPDAGLIFDEIFARGKTCREHPNKISSMMFHFATIIIHDIFRTQRKDPNKTQNSSYLDLAPLYGSSKKEQHSIRTLAGDGRLKPDTFAETRLLAFPPGVCALLVCFNRFHNYVAENLLQINEGGRFDLVKQEMMSEEDLEEYKTPEGKRDNDLFQTARLITCGLYINIILNDYVKTIINLNVSASEWTIDPRERGTDLAYGPSGIPEGIGNQVSVEFNLVYRWHSAISAKDEQWTIDFFKKTYPGFSPQDLTPEMLQDRSRVLFEKLSAIPPEQRTFGDLAREKNGVNRGKFRDEDLMELLTGSTDDIGGAFGARNVPVVMKVVDVMGIEQARKWNVATLNEFRQYFGMMPHTKFSDITSDKAVAQSLETLYGDPKYVELYPGLVAEDAKKPVLPGSGLCPGYTISRAILADAVALVRGDRFYTVDYNAATLTNWGFNQVAVDNQVAHGGVMYKLLMRSFPDYYRTGSVYAFFPFTHPSKTREIMRSLGKEKSFNYDKPKFVPEPKQVLTWKATRSILGDQTNFKVVWGDHTYYLTGNDFMLSGDAPSNRAQHDFITKALYCPQKGLTEIQQLYEKVTMSIIYEKARKLRHGFQIDLVADIANMSHAIAVAQIFHVPLKSESQPVGPLTPTAFYTMMTVIFAYVFLDFDSASSFALRAGAKQSADALGKIMKLVVSLVQNEHFTSLKEMLGIDLHHSDLARSYGTKLIQRMSEGDQTPEEVAWAMIPTIAGAVGTQAQALAQMMDILLSEKYEHHWPKIQKLAQSEEPEAFVMLQKYVLECCRLNPSAFGVLREVAAEKLPITDGDKTFEVKKGDRIFTVFTAVGRDPNVFPNPDEIDLTRDPASYIHHGFGPHTCIGRSLTLTALATQLRCLGKLTNFRRAPGLQGQMKYKNVKGAFKIYMKPDWSDFWPFPTTMKVLFDGID